MTLNEFARAMLADGRLTLSPGSMQSYGRAIEAILFRDGCWQVELVASPPDIRVPRHRHNRVASVDVLLCGSIDGVVGSRRTKPNSGPLERNLLPVPKGVWHWGEAGPSGALYLSFQKWDGTPTFISDDWEEQQ